MLRSRWRLSLVLLIGLGAPLAVSTTAIVVNARKSLRNEAFQENLSVALLGAQVVEAHFEGLSRYVEAHARNRELASAMVRGNLDAMREQLQKLVESNAQFDRAFLTTPEGIENCDWPTDPSVIGKSFAFRDWYIGVSTRQATYVSEVYLRAGAPRLDIVAVAAPVRDPESGAVAGYLVAQYPLATLTERLASIRPADLGAMTLIDHRGRLASGRTEATDAPRPAVDSPLVQAALAGVKNSAIELDPVTQLPVLRSVAPVDTIGWVVSAVQPTDVVFAPAVALQRVIIGLSALCLLGLLALGFLCLEVVRRHHLALVELQELKDQLGSMIIHDLRNPLTAALLSLEMVGGEADALAPVARRDLRNATLSARRMRALIDSLIDVMKLEAGKLELQRAPEDLAALVRGRTEEYRALAASAGLRLEAAVPASPLLASVDGRLVARVLDNLITNAIKHTPAGGRVDVRLSEQDGGGAVALSVADTGEGIRAEELPKLFQKFSRASGQALGRARDAGLGLVFCRLAAELHGGHIGVESAPGRGSTFTLVLPRGADGGPARVT